jgi:hypothetical protein
MFRSRNEWFVHELQNHRRHWICVLCATYFNNRTLFSNHLEIKHQVSTSDPQFGALVLQSEEAVDTIPAHACPFCDEWEETLMDPKHDARRAFLNDGQDVKPYGTLKQFRRHLGRHMEQLALFALPMAENEDPEDDSASGHHEDSVNSASTSVQAYDDDDNNYYVGGGGESSVLHAEQQLLLQQQMAEMDAFDIPQAVRLPPGIPPDVKNWGQLKQWVGTNPSSGPDILELMKALQRIQMVRSRNQAQNQAGQMQPGVPGGQLGMPTVPPGLAAQYIGEASVNAGQEQMLVDAKNADPEFETLASDQRAHIDTKRSDEEVQSQAERAQEYLNISEEDIRKIYLLAEDLRKTGMDEAEIQLSLKKDYPDRPTSTRMSRKHLSLETLKQYHIEFEIDTDPDYLLIKRWVPEYEQDFLWNHTRELRQKRAENAEDIATSNFSAGSRRSPGDTELPEIAGEEEQRRQKIGEDDNVELISIESHPVGLIIGRKGENLRRIEAETGCRLQIVTGPNVTGPYRQCKITGTRAARAKAKAEINRIIYDSGMAELELENRERRKRYHSDDRISPDIRVRGDLNFTGRETTTSAASSSQPAEEPRADDVRSQNAPNEDDHVFIESFLAAVGFNREEGGMDAPEINTPLSSGDVDMKDLGEDEQAAEDNIPRKRAAIKKGEEAWLPLVYKKGEEAWLSVEGRDGSFPVSIDSEGKWDYAEHQWKYQVKQTDGRLYGNGKWVGEIDLNRTQK